MTMSASRASRRAISCPSADAQVGGHRFLVARLHVPPQRRAFMQQPPLRSGSPPGPCPRGGLDLDDFGAELGENLAGERTGNELARAPALSGQRADRAMYPCGAGMSDRRRRCGGARRVPLRARGSFVLISLADEDLRVRRRAHFLLPLVLGDALSCLLRTP